MRARNQHTAPIDALEPGAVGEVDETNPAVKLYLDTGLLVAEVEASPEPAPAEAPRAPAPSPRTRSTREG